MPLISHMSLPDPILLKRALKVCIGALFATFTLLRRAILRILGYPVPATCVVLCYHSVPPHLINRFKWQMDRIIRRARVIRADYDGPLKPGGHYVAVTVDDGFTCAAAAILPEMEERNIPFHLFVPPQWLGRKAEWRRDRQIPDKETVMTAEQLAALSRRPVVTIGSHCLTHRSLLSMGDEEARKEIFESGRLLESMTSRAVDTLSFPYGEYNERHVECARQAGYRRVFTVDPLPALLNTGEFVTGRVDVDPGDWHVEFRLKLSGCYSWMVRAGDAKRRMKRWWRRLTAGPMHEGFLHPGGTEDEKHGTRIAAG